MTENARAMMNAEPFIPFVIKTSDGREYRVRHPDYLAISPNGAWMTVYADEEVGTMLSAAHVVAVEPRPARTRGRR